MTDTDNTAEREGGQGPWEMLWHDEWEEIRDAQNNCIMANTQFYPLAPNSNTMVRIVAAWNACEGIPTEALEAGVVKDMLEALRRCVDDLECALRDGYDGVWSEDDFEEHLAPYRTAIAKATRGAA